MSHERKKKGGERKDKKMARMREAVAERAQPPQQHGTDQGDIVAYKSGSQGDRNREARPDT